MGRKQGTQQQSDKAIEDPTAPKRARSGHPEGVLAIGVIFTLGGLAPIVWVHAIGRGFRRLSDAWTGF